MQTVTMTSNRGGFRKYLAALSVLMATALGPLSARAALPVDAELEASVRAMTAQLASICPLADPGDQKAFDQCRQQLFGDSKFRQMLSPYTLWGRQIDPNLALKDTKLTQFGPEILSGLYASLFMFDGSYKIVFNEREKLYMATLGVAFRNRLQPGQFPYPFWHDNDKWMRYENARSIVMYIDPASGKIRVAQFSINGDRPELAANAKAMPPAFDGKWLWTDKDGKTQPAVTLFDGLFASDNPYKEKMSQSYRELAMTLRDSQCFSCHVPNNPDGMKRLVLLQSPAHAASEIKRVLKAVSSDTMPRDEFDSEKPLDPQLKKALLEKGGEFDRLVDLARAWEQGHRASLP